MNALLDRLETTMLNHFLKTIPLVVLAILNVAEVVNGIRAYRISTCEPNQIDCYAEYDAWGHRERACVSRNSFCDGKDDCPMRDDEKYCDKYLAKFNGGCPSTWFECNNGRCIPNAWKCNGYVDCFDESDESGCDYMGTPSTTPMPTTPQPISGRKIEEEVGTVGQAKKKLISWFLNTRKEGTTTNRWSHHLPRTAAALFLADKRIFLSGNKTGEEMSYELTIQLLSRLAGCGRLRTNQLAAYINAMLVTCLDPRNFHGFNLVSDLRAAVEEGNYTANPFDFLVLCNAGDKMSTKDAERISAIFDSQHRPFWTDNQAIATMALACVSSREGVSVDERTLMDMGQELKRRQFRNGTVDNLKTTALVVQALIAINSSMRDFDLNAAINVLMQNQKPDGSIGSLLDSYYVLPVLSNTSLVKVTSNHCARPTTTEEEALNEFQRLRGDRLLVQFSIWIGDEVDLRRTWTMKVSTNSTFYDVMETSQRLDKRQRIEYNVIDGKPYVSSVSGLQDDLEMNQYWFSCVRTQGSEEDPKIMDKSPVDVWIQPNQEIILWYKVGKWSE